MRLTKRISLIGTCVALLLSSQFLLSGVSGVEVVTVLFLCFCFVFGAVNGMIVGTMFSLIRCFIFGFYPTVIILYLIYYNLFALFFGLFGKKGISKLRFVLVIFFAVLFTAFFSILDDIITPLYYGLDFESAKAYFYSSITFAIIPQCICTFITTLNLFYPLSKIFKMLK